MKVQTYKPGGSVSSRPDQTPYQSGRGSNAGYRLGQTGFAAGQKMEQHALEMQAEQDENTAKELDVAFNRELRGILHDPESGFYGKRGKVAFESFGSTQQQLEELQAKYEGMAQNDEQRAMFGSAARARVESSLDGMARHSGAERRAWMTETSQARISESINNAVASFTVPKEREISMRVAQDELSQIATREGWDSEKLKREQGSLSTRFHAAILDRMLVSDPFGAMKYFKEKQSNIDGVSRAKIERALKGELDRIKTERRVQIGGQLEDYIAFVGDGNTGGRRPVDTKTIRSVYGDKADEVLEKINRAEAFGANMATIRTASPEELREILSKEAEDLAGQEGYKTEKAELTALQRAIQQRNQQINDDPAGYTIKSFPEVASAYRVLSEEMQSGSEESQKAAIASYVATVREKQEQLGVPMPELLSGAYAQEIAARFNNTEEGGETSYQTISAMSELWGEAWPDVVDQLTGSKLVPGSVAVISAMDNPLRAGQLSEAVQTGEGAYKDLLGKTNVRDIEESVAAEMVDFQESLIGLEGHVKTYNQFHESASLLAMKLMTEGMDSSTAVEAAVGSVILDRYTFQDGYRVPVGADADSVSRGLAWLRSNPEKMGLKIPESVHIQNADDARNVYHEALSFDIVTLRDDAGLALVDADGYALQKEDGSPVIYSWDELSQFSSKVKKPSAFEQLQGNR